MNTSGLPPLSRMTTTVEAGRGLATIGSGVTRRILTFGGAGAARTQKSHAPYTGAWRFLRWGLIPDLIPDQTPPASRVLAELDVDVAREEVQPTRDFALRQEVVQHPAGDVLEIRIRQFAFLLDVGDHDVHRV